MNYLYNTIANARRKLRLILQNNKITLSGEVNVTSTDIKKAVSLDDKSYRNLEIHLEHLREEFPFLNIELFKELHEIGLKVTVYQMPFDNFKFIERLESVLSDIVNDIYSDDIKVRVNFFGEINSWKENGKILAVNDYKTIYCDQLETQTKNSISRWIGNFVENILLRDLF